MEVDEENKSQYESDSDDGSTMYEKDNDFQPHNNYATDEEDDNDEDEVVKAWELETVTDNLKIPGISDHYSGPHGLKEGVEKIFANIIE